MDARAGEATGRAHNRRRQSQRWIRQDDHRVEPGRRLPPAGSAESCSIDADPQANASLTLLDGATVEEPTLSQVLLDQAEAIEAIRPSRVKRVDILPADARLADAALLLAEQLGRERRLRSALHDRRE